MASSQSQTLAEAPATQADNMLRMRHFAQSIMIGINGQTKLNMKRDGEPRKNGYSVSGVSLRKML